MAVIDMDKVVEVLTNEFAIKAYVEQTGGGCATIYAGDEVDGRYEALVGPGWFEGPGWTQPRADTTELAVGPDDDGEAEPVWATETWREHDVAVEVKTQVHVRRTAREEEQA